MTVRVPPLTGKLPALARIRIAVFRDWRGPGRLCKVKAAGEMRKPPTGAELGAVALGQHAEVVDQT